MINVSSAAARIKDAGAPGIRMSELRSKAWSNFGVCDRRVDRHGGYGLAVLASNEQDARDYFRTRAVIPVAFKMNLGAYLVLTRPGPLESQNSASACDGTEPASANIGVGDRAPSEADRRSTRTCAR